MRNAGNILRHELIGLRCKVVKSENAAQAGIEGKIVDETMKTVIIDGKRVQKKGSVFSVALGAKRVEIDGNYLLSRPEDRIKKKISKW